MGGWLLARSGQAGRLRLLCWCASRRCHAHSVAREAAAAVQRYLPTLRHLRSSRGGRRQPNRQRRRGGRQPTATKAKWAALAVGAARQLGRGTNSSSSGAGGGGGRGGAELSASMHRQGRARLGEQRRQHRMRIPDPSQLRQFGGALNMAIFSSAQTALESCNST